jgi:hypothetical protein
MIADVFGVCGTRVGTIGGATPSGSDWFHNAFPWVGTHGYSCLSASRMEKDTLASALFASSILHL